MLPVGLPPSSLRLPSFRRLVVVLLLMPSFWRLVPLLALPCPEELMPSPEELLAVLRTAELKAGGWDGWGGKGGEGGGGCGGAGGWGGEGGGGGPGCCSPWGCIDEPGLKGSSKGAPLGGGSGGGVIALEPAAAAEGVVLPLPLPAKPNGSANAALRADGGFVKLLGRDAGVG